MPLPLPVINPQARISGFTVGHTPSNIIVIDDVFRNAGAIEAYGRREAVYVPPAGTAYPGLNAPLPQDFMAPLADALRPLIERAYQVPPGQKLACHGYFGLVTLPPDRLSAIQSVPHVDNVGPRRLAVLVYLCGEDQGGTGYYRHRATGLERLTGDNITAYTAAVAAETEDGVTPGYAVGDHALFERIGVTEARFNRLVVYNCNLLHSGQVDGAKLSPDPAKGRLTLNLFIGEP